MASASSPVESPTNRERWLVALVTVAALGLRAWQLQRTGLSQFDEGVYAFSGLGLIDPSQPHRLFPDQQKFSPPLYFSLVALSYLVGGISDRSAILVNVALGTLTVPVLWWVGRRWVGGPAAVAAATMLAFSGNHVQLSRVALTDVTFALTFLIALAAVARALDRERLSSSVIAGLAVGLAWNTKYHGWFALVIGAMTIVARWRVERETLAALRGKIRAWVVMSVVATACYAPWMVFISSQPGATSGWAAYFATMLRIDWLGNFAVHAERLWHLESAWSRSSVALAVLVSALAGRTPLSRLSWRALLLALVGAVIGSAATAVVLTVVAIARDWKAPPNTGILTMAAVVVLWSIMAPFYQPYFRLLLPFSIATFVLAGRAASAWIYEDAAASSVAPPWAMPALLVTAAVVAILMPRQSSAWRSARGLAAAANAIDARVQPGAPIAVLGEPPLAFYLHRRGHPSFGRTTLRDFDEASAPMLFVTGLYARRAPSIREGLRKRSDAIEVLGRYPVDPPDLRLFDDNDPEAAVRYRQHPDTAYDLVLCRYDPARYRRAATP